MESKQILSLFVISLLLVLSYSCKEDEEDKIETKKIPTSGLILHYTFDNNISDNSGSNNSGIGNGIFSYSTGLFNKAISFTSANSGYISTTSYPSIDSTSFTISCFIKSTKFDEEQGILQRGCVESGNRLYGYGISLGDNVLAAWVGHGNSDVNALVFNGNISNGNWRHVALSFDKSSGLVSLYLDGIMVESKILDSGNIIYKPNYDDGFTIGRRVAGSYDFAQFEGSIDQLRIYNRCLSANEIKILFEE